MGLVKDVLQFVLATDLNTKELKVKVMSLFNLSEDEATHLLIRAKSELHKPKLLEAKKRLVLLPQCIRNKECKAPLTEEGFACDCAKCSLPCQIKEIKAMTKSPCYILPGGSMVIRILEKEKPGGVIGIACNKEIEMGMDACEKAGLPSVGVTLLRDGCVNTLVDMNTVKQLFDEVENGAAPVKEKTVRTRKRRRKPKAAKSS